MDLNLSKAVLLAASQSDKFCNWASANPRSTAVSHSEAVRPAYAAYLDAQLLAGRLVLEELGIYWPGAEWTNAADILADRDAAEALAEKKPSKRAKGAKKSK